MSEIVIGYGQIGKAVQEIIGDPAIVDEGLPVTYGTFDIMHICFPYSENFIVEVKRYIKEYKPAHIIIYSTVPIGTTKKIAGAVHSPIEGKHPKLAESIRLTPRWIGANSISEGNFWFEYFDRLELGINLLRDSDYTEALKLLSTAEYGINIVFADYKKKIADKLGMDYSLMIDWNENYNRLYRDLGLEQFQKFILEPPEGPVGGHCIVPNSELLDEQFPHDMLKMIKEVH